MATVEGVGLLFNEQGGRIRGLASEANVEGGVLFRKNAQAW